jgi:hypothetical protein
VNKHNVCIQINGCRELIQERLKSSEWCGLIHNRIPRPFWGAMEKLQKVNIRFVTSIHPSSICMEQLSSHWTDFYEVSYLRIFFLNPSSVTET